MIFIKRNMIKILITTKENKIVWHIHLSTIFYKLIPKEKMRNFLLEEVKNCFKKDFDKYIKKSKKNELVSYGIPFNGEEVSYDNFKYIIENPEIIMSEYRDVLSGDLSIKEE